MSTREARTRREGRAGRLVEDRVEVADVVAHGHARADQVESWSASTVTLRAQLLALAARRGRQQRVEQSGRAGPRAGTGASRRR